MFCWRIFFCLILLLLWCRPRSGMSLTGSVLPEACPPLFPVGAVGRSPRHCRYLKRAGGSPSNRRPKLHSNLFLVFFLLLLSGDVELNPGPGRKNGAGGLEAGPQRSSGEGEQSSPNDQQPNRILYSTPQGTGLCAGIAGEVMGELLDDSCSPIYGPGQKQHIRWGLDLTASHSTEQGFDLPEWKTLYVINRNHLHSLMDDEDPIGNQGDNANMSDLLSNKLGERVYDVPANLAHEVKISNTFLQYLRALNLVVESLGRLHYWGDVNPVDVHDALAHAWKNIEWKKAMTHQAWLCRAMSKVSRDVSCFLNNCVERDCIVNKYHPENLEEEMHMIHKTLVIATSELDMKKFGKRIRILGKTSMSRKRRLSSCENELSGLEAKIQKIENPMIMSLDNRLSELKKQVDRESRMKIRAKRRIQAKIKNAPEPDPPSVPIADSDTWKERVLEVTHCQDFNEHCKIVCQDCQWDFRGRSIKLKSFLSHLYTKHGGFTPSKVNSRNRYLDLIPLKIDDGEEEKRRIEETAKRTSRANKNLARQSRLRNRSRQI